MTSLDILGLEKESAQGNVGGTSKPPRSADSASVETKGLGVAEEHTE